MIHLRRIAAIISLMLMACGSAVPARAAVGCIGDDSEDCRWNAVDYTLQSGFLMLTTADWVFTSKGIDRYGSNWYERNPILGVHPSQSKVGAYFVLTMSSHTAIAMLIPKPWRTVWQSVWVGVEIQTLATGWSVNIDLVF